MKNNMTVKEFYNKIGGNYEKAYEKYSGDDALSAEVVKFLHDSSFAELQTCIAASDYAGAYNSAASLCECYAALCFTELSAAAEMIKSKLYGADTFDDIALFGKVKNEYESVVSALRILETEN